VTAQPAARPATNADADAATLIAGPFGPLAPTGYRYLPKDPDQKPEPDPHPHPDPDPHPDPRQSPPGPAVVPGILAGHRQGSVFPDEPGTHR
jgi:hypothetical protein